MSPGPSEPVEGWEKGPSTGDKPTSTQQCQGIVWTGVTPESPKVLPCLPSSWLGSWGPRGGPCLCFSCLARIRFILGRDQVVECQAGQHMGAHPGCYLLSLQLGQGLLLGLAVQFDAFEIGSIVEGDAPMRKDSEVQKGPSP